MSLSSPALTSTTANGKLLYSACLGLEIKYQHSLWCRHANVDYCMAFGLRQQERSKPLFVPDSDTVGTILTEDHGATFCATTRRADNYVPTALSLQVSHRAVSSETNDVTTYDNSCNYSVHVVSRFEQYFADVAPLVAKIRWGIPAVHIGNHKEDCNYVYNTAYMDGAAHFHGETAEQYWPHINKVGSHVQHMRNGHRQDTLNDHHGDWNWKKTQGLGELFIAS